MVYKSPGFYNLDINNKKQSKQNIATAGGEHWNFYCFSEVYAATE